MRGIGGVHAMPKRRSLCVFTCDPIPSMKRPFDAFCRSQALCAVIVGERGNAMATAVPSWTRSVASAAAASGKKGLWAFSAVTTASNSSLLRQLCDLLGFPQIVVRNLRDHPHGEFPVLCAQPLTTRLTRPADLVAIPIAACGGCMVGNTFGRRLNGRSQ